ncbi:MAG: hypothetical protein ACAI38_23510 [Myxococcota bacterium]
MRRLIFCLVLLAGCSSNVNGSPGGEEDPGDGAEVSDDDSTDVGPGDGDGGSTDESTILSDLTIETPTTLAIGEALVVTARLTNARSADTTVVWSIGRGEQLEYAAVSSSSFGGELPVGDATLVIPTGELVASSTLATGTAGLAEALALSLSFSADGGTTVRSLAITPRATDIKDIAATAYHGRVLRHDGVVLTAQGCPSAAGTALTHEDLPPLARIATGGLGLLFAQSTDDVLLAMVTETLQITDDGHVVDVDAVTDPDAAQIVGMRESYYEAYLSYADGTLKRMTPGGVATLVATSPRHVGLPMLEAFALTADAAGVVTLTPSPFFPYDSNSIPQPYATWPDLRAFDGLHAVVLAVRGNGDLIAIESLVNPDDAPGPFPNHTVTRTAFVPDATNVVEVKLSFSRTFVRWANGDVRWINGAGNVSGFSTATLSSEEPQRFSHPPVRTVGCYLSHYCALLVGNTIECL